jgi:hypothetical protein
LKPFEGFDAGRERDGSAPASAKKLNELQPGISHGPLDRLCGVTSWISSNALALASLKLQKAPGSMQIFFNKVSALEVEAQDTIELVKIGIEVSIIQCNHDVTEIR